MDSTSDRNPFLPPATSPTRATSPTKPLPPNPPNASLFNPQLQRQNTGPAFRNPAFASSAFRNPSFTTPQRRGQEIQSEAEDSPALTDTSEMMVDTPDYDRDDDYPKYAATSSRASRSLFKKPAPSTRSHTPGRGEIPRGSVAIGTRDKVRKRRRQTGDRDIGSTRSRLSHDSDESDSDWEENNTKKSKKKSGRQGFFTWLIGTLHSHPNLPAILRGYIFLAFNFLFIAIFGWAVWGLVEMVRYDLAGANDERRGELLAEIAACAAEFNQNRCSPVSARLPALEKVCQEWELCMNRDPNNFKKMQVSAENVAQVINSFVGIVSIKSWVSTALPRRKLVH